MSPQGKKEIRKNRGKKEIRKNRGKNRRSKEKPKSTKTTNRSEKGKKSGLKAGGELGIDSDGRTLGKVKAGGELGVKENKKGSGKFEANVNLGLESDTLEDLKAGSDYAVDKIKSGIKAAKKKIAKVKLPGMEDPS
jgi:hypothetical protein